MKELPLKNRWASRVAGRITLCALTLAVTWLAAASPTWAGDRATFAIKAKRIHTLAGEPVDDGVLVVRDGRIAEIRSDAPAGMRLLDHSDAVIMPGMVDVVTRLGASAHLSDSTHAVQPDLDAADVFNPGHHEFDDACRRGVTTVVLMPSAANVAGGTAVAVKTAGPIAHRMIAAEEPLLSLSISRSVNTFRSRVPTSRMGTIDLFRRTLDQASTANGTPLAALAAGKARAVVHCSSAADLAVVAAEAANRGMKLSAAFVADVSRSLDAMGDHRIPVIMGPLTTSTRERILRAPGQLAAAGYTVALTSAAPAGPADGLRMTAALAARYDLDADKAVAAITRYPAELAGIGTRVGTLASGMDADFVLLSGEPLDLSSAVLEVYIAGQRVARPHTNVE